MSRYISKTPTKRSFASGTCFMKESSGIDPASTMESPFLGTRLVWSWDIMQDECHAQPITSALLPQVPGSVGGVMLGLRLLLLLNTIEAANHSSPLATESQIRAQLLWSQRSKIQ